ncbi:MAG: hypothetical protein WCO35_00015 [Candidatus Nomurabacteria bacterium]
MKKIFTKIITVYIIVASLAILLKVGDNMLAKASVSNTVDQCGVNNGWIWNGTQCVNFCDNYHPWDSAQLKCSNGYGYSYYGNNLGYVPGSSNYMGSCIAYGSNFYWNGSSCSQIVPGVNNSYYGANPYSGTGYTYINPVNPVNQIPSVPVINYSDDYINNYPYNNNNYTNSYSDYSNGCNNSCWKNPAPKVITTYYVYTQESYPQSYNNQNYIYLGNHCDCGGNWIGNNNVIPYGNDALNGTIYYDNGYYGNYNNSIYYHY